MSKMEELKTKAIDFHDKKNWETRPAYALYRFKPAEYYNDILDNLGGIMCRYMKNQNGDPKCPINGRIEGLHFSCRVDSVTGEVPMKSPFGDTRFVSPIQNLSVVCGQPAVLR